MMRIPQATRPQAQARFVDRIAPAVSKGSRMSIVVTADPGQRRSAPRLRPSPTNTAHPLAGPGSIGAAIVTYAVSQVRDSDDLDALLASRHHVLAEIDALAPLRSDQRLRDPLDAAADAIHVALTHHGRIVGGVRFTPAERNAELVLACLGDGEVGDGLLDGRPRNPATAVLDQLFLEPIYRGTPLVGSLLAFGYALLERRGRERVVAVVTTRSATAFVRNGYRILAPTCRAGTLAGRLPLLLELSEIPANVRAMMPAPSDSARMVLPEPS